MQQWFSKLDSLKKVQVHCYLQPRTVPAETTIHMFVGASKEAFGAVSYARNAQPRFIASKTKVAPLATMIILRLELYAAVMKDCSMRNLYLLMFNIPLFSLVDIGSQSLLLNNTMSLEIMLLEPITHSLTCLPATESCLHKKKLQEGKTSAMNARMEKEKLPCK